MRKIVKWWHTEGETRMDVWGYCWGQKETPGGAAKQWDPNIQIIQFEGDDKYYTYSAGKKRKMYKDRDALLVSFALQGVEVTWREE